MTTERLDVRLGREQRRKLRELAAEQHSPISDVVRRLIDKAYEESLAVRRKRAVEELGRLTVEDLPDPSTVNEQLEATHEPGGLY